MTVERALTHKPKKQTERQQGNPAQVDADASHKDTEINGPKST
jgi:hypothetical protein